MHKVITAAWTAALLAIPIAAKPQTPMRAFDGSYAGVSREIEEGGMVGHNTARCQIQAAGIAPLTIVNGVARTPWGPGNTFEGTVSPQGVIRMRTPRGQQLDAQIDPQGRVSGRLTGECAYRFVWQKREPVGAPVR
ncbi:MAG: hypothetical protein JO249_05600 [Acidobacteria bacterium]|nr:hypothetical protein [Acidobacteriota bacterium]